MWKKVLLAVCIIACIFNLMSKLVNRRSLKENLDAANDGTTVFNIFKNSDVEVKEVEQVENVDEKNNEKDVEEDTQVYNENKEEINKKEMEEENSIVNDEIEENTNVEEQNIENSPEEQINSEKDDNFQYKDFDFTNFFN